MKAARGGRGGGGRGGGGGGGRGGGGGGRRGGIGVTGGGAGLPAYLWVTIFGSIFLLSLIFYICCKMI